MVRNLGLANRAKDLRKQGKSYSEIRKSLGVAKSTLSEWFSKKEWSKHITRDLNNKYLPQNKSRIILMNESKKQKRIARHRLYQTEAEALYHKLGNNPLFVAGVFIYWGEGEKLGNGRISVINTDARILQIMIRFYRQVLKVPDRLIRAGLFIYSDLDPIKTLNYWSKMLNLPKGQFIKTHILQSKIGPTKRRSLYGMCNIYVSRIELKIKILRWIELFTQDYAQLV
ncbi:MAG: hypothetical protein Q7S31_03915 [bacterium]|nr:hypothetical protein [bacterium]